MFARLIALLQLRRSTAFLLERDDDHLLDDIGLTRSQLEAMRLGLDLTEARAKISRYHSLPAPRGLPVGALA
ncbi:MAG: hypothetical protein JNK19_06675 [Tabrizicola sp.]|nr:hypothetical protein [Tabrizicola sp.]